MEDEKKRIVKKKPTISFKTYIHKLLKQVHPNNQISSNAIEQLDEFNKILARKLSENARNTCANSKKSTVGTTEIQLAVKLHFPGKLGKQAVSELAKSVLRFKKYADEGEFKNVEEGKRMAPTRRETQAGLIFAVSLCEKFIRGFGTSDLNVSKSASVALASVLEYVTSEILELSGKLAVDDKRVIILVRHIFLAVHSDSELLRLGKEFDIEFLGGGVVPYIHSEFIPSEEKRQEQASRRKKDSKGRNSDKKPHKFRPGDKALMEIKKYQKSTELLLRKLPFSRAVKEMALETNKENNFDLKDIHFGFGAMRTFQYFIEMKVTSLCMDAAKLAIHGKRDGVNADDIKLAWELREPRIPYTEKTIEEIGDNGIERLTLKGGIKRKGNGIYPEIRRYIYSLVGMVIFKTLNIISYRGVITIGIQDLRNSFSSLGYNVTIPSSFGKPKQNKEKSSLKKETEPKEKESDEEDFEEKEFEEESDGFEEEFEE